MTWYLWLCAYLILNVILGVISRSLIEYWDVTYWQKGNDAKHNLFTLILAYPELILARYGAFLYGYLFAYILVKSRVIYYTLTLRYYKVYEMVEHLQNRIKKEDKWFHIKLKIITSIILILFCLPIFLYGAYSEIRIAIKAWWDDRNN
jgi:hypothetical protein